MTLNLTEVAFSDDVHYDCAFAFCGFERRASYLVRSGLHASVRLCIEPGGADTHSQIENRGIFSENGWSTVTLAAAATRLRAESSSARIAIDITSFPRATLARLVEACVSSSSVKQIDFFYAPAAYAESAAAASAQVTLSAGPVSPFFRGSLRAPSIPICLMVGLGLEEHRALGMIELLEPSETWAFFASGGDAQFEEAMASMFPPSSGLPELMRVISYDLNSPSSTYSVLESLVFRKSPDFRVILAPSGPKIFGLVSMLASATADPLRPAVWRVGSSVPGGRTDVPEAGPIIGARLRMQLSPAVTLT